MLTLMATGVLVAKAFLVAMLDPWRDVDCLYCASRTLIRHVGLLSIDHERGFVAPLRLYFLGSFLDILALSLVPVRISHQHTSIQLSR